MPLYIYIISYNVHENFNIVNYENQKALAVSMAINYHSMPHYFLMSILMPHTYRNTTLSPKWMQHILAQQVTLGSTQTVVMI